MAKRKQSDQTLIKDTIYPIIENVIEKRKTAYKGCIERFIHENQDKLYDYAPIDRIFFRKKDTDDFFHSINVDENEVLANIKQLYYYDDPELQCCKDPFSISQLMVLRHFMIKKDTKLIELSAMYLAFSGKFYASCHYNWFPSYTPKRNVMDYVVNYMLSKKFDLITEGSVWGAIRNLVNTWMNTYNSILIGKFSTDEEFNYIMHQLYERIYAFLRNIAKPYFEAYEKKLYINTESDNYNGEDGKYRVVNNNSTRAAGITETTMNYFTTTSINIARCHAASSKGVDPGDIKSIFENILDDNEKLNQLREVINIILVDFMKNYPDEKDITNSVEFINYTIKAKPNTKDPNLIKLKNYILGWLNTSQRYRNIKTVGTKNNYYRAILIYIVLTINTANKEG